MQTYLHIENIGPFEKIEDFRKMYDDSVSEKNMLRLMTGIKLRISA